MTNPYYSPEQTLNLHTERFAYLEVQERDQVLYLTLNRPAKRNALCPKMVHELAFALAYAQHSPGVWAYVIRANGPVFCAGADLQAFMGKEEAHNSSITAPTQEVLIGELFRQVHKPGICVLEGDVMAGGLFFPAGCLFTVAEAQVKFSLPEVRRGLFPFQVMAALMEVIPARRVLGWCVRGGALSAQEAFETGLVTQLAASGEGPAVAAQLLAELLANSPTAIRMGMAAFETLRREAPQEAHSYLYQQLMLLAQSADAREGMMAFMEKRPPVWKGE